VNGPLHVLVVDMNVGFSERGALSSPRVGAIVPDMADFLRSLPPRHHLSAAGTGSEVVFIGDSHRPGDPELARFPEHCMERSGEDGIRPELIRACEAAGIVSVIHHKKEHDGFIVDDAAPSKSFIGSDGGRRSCFRLDSLTADSDEWVVVGCVTDICVDINVGALVMRGKRVTVVRSLIETYDLPLEKCRELGLPDHAAHDADKINEFWFGHRFPALWGARVVGDWRELL
jgi:nicotinamidase-related amidase